jgi:putative ABC transport system substrate-binding protein
VLWIEAAKPSPQLAPLLQGLRARGYVVGENLRIDDRFVVDRYERLADAAARLVASKPDVIVTYGGTAIAAAYKATSTIPIVMVGGGNPVRLGVVKSLAKPGGNVTGLTSISTDLSGKRLELLKQAFPPARRVAVVLYPGSEVERQSLKIYESAAAALQLEVRVIEVRSAADIARVVAPLARADADVIAFIGSTLFRANAPEIVAAAAKTRLPAIYTDALYPELGGVMSYGPNIADNFRQVGVYIDKILKGAKAADLPVEQPTRLELVINARAAKEQGIELGQALLARADRIIQ